MNTIIKITKTDKVNAIKDYLYLQGKRMTNLSSATDDKLNEMITKYEINIQEYAEDRKEQMKEQRKIDKKNKEERKKKEDEESAIRMEMINKIKKLKTYLNEDYMINYQAVILQLLEKDDLKKNREKYEKLKIQEKEHCDRELMIMKTINPYAPFERISDTEIRLGGRIWSFGGGYDLDKPSTIESLQSEAKFQMCRNYIELYQYGILEPMVEINKEYINAKTEWIMNKNKNKKIIIKIKRKKIIENK